MTDSDGAVVVVGCDGSADSANALKWAERYASATGAALRLVTAWEWPQSYGTPLMYDGYDPRADAQTLVEKAAAEVSLPGARIETCVDEGQPGPVLVRASAGAAALVVGSHGHSAVSRVLLGSVSTYSVHHATCPVVVVR